MFTEQGSAQAASVSAQCCFFWVVTSWPDKGNKPEGEGLVFCGAASKLSHADAWLLDGSFD